MGGSSLLRFEGTGGNPRRVRTPRDGDRADSWRHGRRAAVSPAGARRYRARAMDLRLQGHLWEREAPAEFVALRRRFFGVPVWRAPQARPEPRAPRDPS